MTNILSIAYEIVSIARRHGIAIEETAEPADVAEQVLEQLKERSRLARGDIKTLESLTSDLAVQRVQQPKSANGSLEEHHAP